nr:FGGY-family carbohydrate kinase [Cohnella sp. REN36]
MGIDIGTYESKGVIADRDGRVLAQAATPHRLEIPRRGWAEHDAEATWWHDFKVLSRTLLAEAGDRHGIRPEEVKAVGTSAIAPALLPVDRQGRPLRKAILYGIDTRAEQEIAELNAMLGEQAVWQVAGQALTSQAAGPKIRWIRNREPEIYARTDKFLCGSGYLVYKLTGEYVIDRYTAVNYAPLFDIRSLDWHEGTVSRITDPDKLPRLAWSCDIVGTVSPEAAQETGLTPGTRVVAGTADAMAEAISVGAVRQGDLMLMYGSSTFFILTTDAILQTKQLWPNVHAVPGLHTLTGGTATAGSLTRWFVDQHPAPLPAHRIPGGPANFRTLDEAYTYWTDQAGRSPPGANGLLTLPFFSGERTPIHDASAKGTLFGLSLHHTAGDVYRSLLEGISFSIRHNLETMKDLGAPIERVMAVGGGVKNRLWLQSVSDICQLPQAIPKVTVGAAYGNAYICSLALGWHRSLQEVERWVAIDNILKPAADHSELYEKRYTLYRNLYEQTRNLMKEL